MAEHPNQCPALCQWIGESWWLTQRKLANWAKPVSLFSGMNASGLQTSIQEANAIKSCPFKVGDWLERKGCPLQMRYVVEEVVYDSDSESVYLLCEDKNGNLTPIWSLKDLKRAEALETERDKHSQAAMRLKLVNVR